MAKVLITGGTGLIGFQLRRALLERGYEVAILSRSKKIKNDFLTYLWDLDENEIDRVAINSVDYIVHLAGVNVGEKRWTSKRKQLILDCRIKSGELILNNIDSGNSQLKAYITASGTGYYGAVTSEKIFTELDSAADDFLGQVCEKWEQVADKFAERGIRTVKIRTGVVLSNRGGALSKMLVPVKLGIGSAIGSGNQYFPWIHIDDLCGIYIKAIEDSSMEGAYNAVAPEFITNRKFTQIIAGHLKKPFWFPNIPSFAFQILFGKMSQILLNGSMISAEKIQNSGFVFRYPNLQEALKQLVG
jgi:uncharacterized protein (TIGR01777 family)